MSLEDVKITSYGSNDVASAPDKLTGTAAQNKAIFDNAIKKVVAVKVNALIDELVASTAGTQLGAELPPGLSDDSTDTQSVQSVINAVHGAFTAHISDVVSNPHSVTASQVGAYTKAETDLQIAQKVIEVGAGDMAKAVYDTDNDGVVDNAKKLGGKGIEYFAVAENGVNVYVHTKSDTVHELTGTGANGRVKVTAEFADSDTFTVNGVAVSTVTGADSALSEDNIGTWVSFVFDGEQVNFKSGGGSAVPVYYYTGNANLKMENEKDYTISFLTSGILTLKQNIKVDIFLVGGGGGIIGQDAFPGGGGGGYTKTIKNVSLNKGDINVTIGGSAGTTIFDVYSVAGGGNGYGYSSTNEGAASGGSGGGGCVERAGAGGSDGSDGCHSSYSPTHPQYGPGKGQGTTTRAFGEADGDLYSPGGGGSGVSSNGARGAGLLGDNSGGGANATGRGYYSYAGNSGIVIIRNAR